MSSRKIFIFFFNTARIGGDWGGWGFWGGYFLGLDFLCGFFFSQLQYLLSFYVIFSAVLQLMCNIDYQTE